MSEGRTPPVIRTARLVIAGIVGIVVVLGLALMVASIRRAGQPHEVHRVNALAGSDDECVKCHRNATPGIVEQFGLSTMAAAEVTCRSCHEVEADHPGAVEHEGTHVLSQPSTAKCQPCHHAEVNQYYLSRHGLPAYVAYAGTEVLSEEHRVLYARIEEAGFQPNRVRNALYRLEGAAVTRFACEDCHNVGRPHPDGSVGECQKCHLRHQFTLEQARRPETCNACHIGPDHPQWEIYQESPHGIAYATGGDHWNWEADPGTLTVNDFLAPTCSTCHFGGFGASGTTHDVGERLTWFLFEPISARRPAWQENQVRMQNICLECHNTNFIEAFYTDADEATEAINVWVRESDQILGPLQEQELVTSDPFDDLIDFVHFELWHHWGRTAKFGMWMQGPDYTQWHGAYEVLRALAELREMAEERLVAAHAQIPETDPERTERTGTPGDPTAPPSPLPPPMETGP